jgi:flagellar motility protein MotE (MotC chaperone)
MMRFIREFRLIPIVLLATICLFALKTFGLVFDGGYLLRDVAANDTPDTDITGTVNATKSGADGDVASVPAASEPPTEVKPVPKRAPKRSWAQEMFNFPDVTGAVGAAKTESSAENAATKDAKTKEESKSKDVESKDAKSKDAKSEDAKSKEGEKSAAIKEPAKGEWTPASFGSGRSPSSAERAILERLSERHSELDARAKELDTREKLLKAAEKRLEGRIAELKSLEKRVDAAADMKDKNEATRFKNVVTMYENMKAKDAAKIFDRLDMKVLVDVSTRINPRRMADIMAQMSPEAAERLTVELASRDKEKPTPELPKIEGHPTAAN